MSSTQPVLVVGGTGRTGRRVLEQLVGRGFAVRAIVRSARGLPELLRSSPAVEVVEADLLSLGDDELRRQLRGCQAVISCLGHTLTTRGIWGRPRDLVATAVARLCRGVEALRPAVPVKFVLMTSVSVQQPGDLDQRRGAFERAVVWLIRGLIPPARDNQRAADFLLGEVGASHPSLQWVVVRPDSLLEGEVSAYTAHPGLVDGLFSPGHTRMANVAHFMCELVANPEVWQAWRGKLPVIVDAAAAGQPAPSREP